MLQWPVNGTSYRRLEDSLDRLAGVRIIAKNAFWDNQRKSYVSCNFGILDEYQICESRRGRKSKQEFQMEIPLTYASFNETLFRSVLANNIKRLDLDFYYSLSSTVAKRLYRFLDKRKRGQSRFEVEMMSLANVNVGLDTEQRRYASQIKQKLDKGHEELEERGFISGWRYRRGKDRRSWFVEYRFPSKVRAEPLKLPEAAPTHPTLVNELIQRGFGVRIASEMVASYEDRIKSKLEIYDQLVRTGSPLVRKNPQGWLRCAIEQDYQVELKGFESSSGRAEREARAAEAARERESIEAREEAERTHLLSFFEGLPMNERASIVETARSRLAFLSPDKRKRIDEKSPVLRGELFSLLRRHYPELQAAAGDGLL